MRGALTLRITDERGNVVMERQYKNRIVTSGRHLVAELFAGAPGGVPPTKVTHMAVGTDASAAADADKGLKAQRDKRKPIASVDYSEIMEAGVQRVRARVTSIFDFADANGPEPLREAGIFTAETGGVMYNRVVFDAVTKTNAFKLTLLWDIVF